MNNEAIDHLIEYLMGTTYSLEHALLMLEIDLDPDDVVEELTITIDVCQGCGRWHETGELHGTHDIYCEDCGGIPEE